MAEHNALARNSLYLDDSSFDKQAKGNALAQQARELKTYRSPLETVYPDWLDNITAMTREMRQMPEPTMQSPYAQYGAQDQIIDPKTHPDFAVREQTMRRMYPFERYQMDDSNPGQATPVDPLSEVKGQMDGLQPEYITPRHKDLLQQMFENNLRGRRGLR
jgi:hypothetical protein